MGIRRWLTGGKGCHKLYETEMTDTILEIWNGTCATSGPHTLPALQMNGEPSKRFWPLWEYGAMLDFQGPMLEFL